MINLFAVGDLFYANYTPTAPGVINQGGTSSSKTYSILQVLFVLLAETGRLTCTVVGQDIPNLKVGALRDALDIYAGSEPLQQLIRSYNKSERIFEFVNGSVLEFKSYDSAQDAKSGKRDMLFVNEANGVPYPIFEELHLRTRLRTYLDYNPNAEFWAHEHLIGRPGWQLIISDHRHNTFLSDAVRAKIEGLKQRDLELWRVYARGKTGKIEGLILRDTHPALARPDGAKYLGTGLDFGFTNDPTAAVDVYLSGGELYLDELIYEPGLTNPDIYARLTAVRPARQFQVVADSAEPKSIAELARLGLPVEPALKGPDSIAAGLDLLRRYRLNLLPSCVGLKKELANYKWKVDRLTGKSTNQPVDAFNHAVDALRYLCLTKLPRAVERRRAAIPSLVR